MSPLLARHRQSPPRAPLNVLAAIARRTPPRKQQHVVASLSDFTNFFTDTIPDLVDTAKNIVVKQVVVPATRQVVVVYNDTGLTSAAQTVGDGLATGANSIGSGLATADKVVLGGAAGDVLNLAEGIVTDPAGTFQDLPSTLSHIGYIDTIDRKVLDGKIEGTLNLAQDIVEDPVKALETVGKGFKIAGINIFDFTKGFFKGFFSKNPMLDMLIRILVYAGIALFVMFALYMILRKKSGGAGVPPIPSKAI